MREPYPATMVEAAAISNLVLHVGFEHEVPISLLRLQAILYELELLHRHDTGVALIGERFTAHPYGPRVMSLQAHYEHVPDGPIRRFAKNAHGESFRNNDLAVIGRVHLVLGYFDATRVGAIIEHQRAKDTPWWNAFQLDDRYLDETDIDDHARTRYQN